MTGRASAFVIKLSNCAIVAEMVPLMELQKGRSRTPNDEKSSGIRRDIEEHFGDGIVRVLLRHKICKAPQLLLRKVANQNDQRAGLSVTSPEIPEFACV